MLFFCVVQSYTSLDLASGKIIANTIKDRILLFVGAYTIVLRRLVALTFLH